MKVNKRICIDLDDTLVDWNGALRKWHNETYGTNLKLEDFKDYNFEVFGTPQEARRKIEIFNNSAYHERFLPIEGSVEAVDILLKRGKELFILTSRSDFLKANTERLIDNQFRNKFSDILYSSNHYSGRENSEKTKAEICRELNDALLIDDSQDYIFQCLLVGIKGILFGDYPWNQISNSVKNYKYRDRDFDPWNQFDKNLTDCLVRAKTWKEVLEKVE